MDNVITSACIIAHTSDKRSNGHGYPTYNASINSSTYYDDPMDIASTTGASKAVKIGRIDTLSLSFSWPEFQGLHGGIKHVLIC